MFEDFIGKEVEFYGVDNCCFKIDRIVFEAMEDPDDGYRSYLGSIEIRNPVGMIFFRQALAKVIVEFDGDHYTFRDVEDNHIWLDFGTDDYDDYYPYFVFNYQPKQRD